MSLTEKLHRLGLAPKEATVYIALLELGTASVQAIARRADVVRPTAYVILEHLATKGLVSKATGPDAKKMLFRAEDPERLERYVEQQLEDLQHRQKDLKHIVPDLRSVFAVGEERPRVRLFEGQQGLTQLQAEFLAAGRDSIMGMTPYGALEALLPSEEYQRRIVVARVKAGISSRHIVVSAEPPLEAFAEDAQVLRETRWVTPEHLPLRSSFAAHGPLLSIVSFRNKIIGVLIEHQDIADSFRALFEAHWLTAASSLRAEAVPVEKRVPAVAPPMGSRKV